MSLSLCGCVFRRSVAFTAGHNRLCGPNDYFQASCPTDSERVLTALTEFYEDTGGASWSVSTNWLKGHSPCEWFGVTCDSNGAVVYVNAESF